MKRFQTGKTQSIVCQELFIPALSTFDMRLSELEQMILICENALKCIQDSETNMAGYYHAVKISSTTRADTKESNCNFYYVSIRILIIF